MTVSRQIILSSSLVALLAALAGFLGWKNMNAIKGVYTEKVAAYHAASQSLEAIKTAAFQIRLIALEEKVKILSDVTDSDQLPVLFSEAIQNLQQQIKQYQKLGIADAETGSRLMNYVDDYHLARQSLYETQEKDIPLKEIAQVEQALSGTVSMLWEKEYADCQKVGKVVVGSLKRLLYGVIGISGITFILALLFGQLIARSLSATLRKLRHSAKQLEKGNYASRISIKGKNEFGQLGKTFNKLAEDLGNAHIIETQNLQLASLNRQLKVKNDSLDSFVYRVSHDLKAPVVNMKSLLKVVHAQLEEENKEPLLKSLFFMDQSATRLEKTIFDLLEVSRIEQHLQAKKKELAIGELLKEIIAENKTIIKDSLVNISYDFDQSATLYFNRANLKSILANLITNSIKYRSTDRLPKIHLQTSLQGDFTCLSIADNGIGIDLEMHRKKLFTMFSRFHNHVEGSGVGLYIVKKLVDENGGKLEIESEPQVGTTLKVYFPLSVIPTTTAAEAILMKED